MPVGLSTEVPPASASVVTLSGDEPVESDPVDEFEGVVEALVGSVGGGRGRHGEHRRDGDDQPLPCGVAQPSGPPH